MANHDSSTESVAAKARTSSTDRMSSLPIEILHHILSLLPMKFAIRTSILSNRWRDLWTFNPIINFPVDYKPPSQDYVDIINQCLRLYNCLNMNRLLLTVSLDPTILADNFKNWIQFAITKGVREIILYISTRRLNSYVPEFLYFHTPLTVFTLYACNFNLPPEFKGFPFLKILKLTCIPVTDQTIATLQSTCPLLEDLILLGCNELVNLNVSARSLKFLKVYAGEYLKKLIVNALQLRCFKTTVELATQISLNVPRLLKAKVSFDNDLQLEETYEWMPLLKSIVHGTSLTVCSRLIQFLIEEYGPFKIPHIAFMNLKEFRLFGDLDDKYEIHALATFLGHCSLLQNIRINFIKERIPPAQGGIIDRCGGEDDIQYLRHLGYALNRLKKIEIVGFSSTKKEIGLVRFLLLKATVLDSLHLACAPDDETKEHIPNSKLEKHLSRLPKISKHAKIVLLELPPD